MLFKRRLQEITLRHETCSLYGCLFLGLLALLPLRAAETENPLSSSAASLSIGRSGELLSIRYTGWLESSESLQGPWLRVPEATSPYIVDPSAPALFFRAIASSDFFSTETVAKLVFQGPFQHHFDLAFAGLPDGIFPPVREKPYFNGIMKYEGLVLPVRMRVRGNSSLQECPFPKLKVKISRTNREGTPFVDAREFKIGTHCAEGGRGNIGRLREQKATYREALVYELMNVLGFVGPKVRRGEVTFQDTSVGGDNAGVGWELTRMGFVFEHVEIVASRLGGRALEDEDIAQLADASFDEQLVVDLMMFHALIGNWDYALSSDGQGLWNTEVILRPDGSMVPVAGDFDLAAWVTGQDRVTAPRDFLPEAMPHIRQLHFELDRIRQEAGEGRFQLAWNRFLAAQEELEAQICRSQLDEEGRQLALVRLGAFFEIGEGILVLETR